MSKYKTILQKKYIDSHLVKRVGWIRAFILGANDGILSVASVIAGMVSGEVNEKAILLAGIAALFAGAVSMATGEYVSVSSQKDIERADFEKEKIELGNDPEFELEELTQIYIKRGLKHDLAKKVAQELTNFDAIGAHLRDELGISEISSANPLQAALVSAVSFSAGASLPLSMLVFLPTNYLFFGIIIATLASLIILGAVGAALSGVSVFKPIIRISLWGMISLGATTLIGKLFVLGV